MKLVRLEIGSSIQVHEVIIVYKKNEIDIFVKTEDGVVIGDYKSMRTRCGQYLSLSDSIRKKHFKAIKEYVEASLRAKATTCDKIIEDIDKYKIQLADNKKISATRFQAMQEAIYGCKVIVRRFFGEKQKVENAIVK